MTERKFTDEEIIEALKRCRDASETQLIKATIDLINRKNAEIERYEAQRQEIFGECIKILAGIEELKGAAQRDIARAKAEAIKEFAEEFKERCLHIGFYPVWIKNMLSYLVKEKTEESNGQKS